MYSEALAAAERRALAELTPYAWVITRDRDVELGGSGKSQVGTAGPFGAPDEYLVLVRAAGVPFRMLDEGDIDDSNDDLRGSVPQGDPEYGVVYEGLLYDPSGAWEFAPLDDFGRGYYGCTDIQYRNDTTGEWESL